MKPLVYIETTIPSYLTAWPSRDLVRAAHQQVTREWWSVRGEYQLFISRLVIQECSAGNSTAAEERLASLDGIPVLDETDSATKLAERLLKEIPLPAKAGSDAFHIAHSAIHGMQYLLTWNCRHIANASLRGAIERICESSGTTPPMICTPLELLPPNLNPSGPTHDRR